MTTTTSTVPIHIPQPLTTNLDEQTAKDNGKSLFSCTGAPGSLLETQLNMPGAYSDNHDGDRTKVPFSSIMRHQQYMPLSLGTDSIGNILFSIMKEVLRLSGRVLHLSGSALHLSSRIILPWLVWPTVWLIMLAWFLFCLTKLSVFVQTSMKPFCILPGLSSSTFCRQAFQPIAMDWTTKAMEHTDYSTLVDMQTQTFDRLLDDAAGGSALSLGVKKAQMATTDLAIMVRMSDLTAKAALADALDEFVVEAIKTGRGLQRWTAKVGGSMDSIMAMNTYALMSIKHARHNEPSPWSPYAFAPWRSRKTLHDVIKQTFHEAMNVLSVNMERLIIEAENSHTNLIKLEEKLALIHEMASREGLNISAEKSELLEQLWTKIGGNKRSIKTFDRHLAILKLLTTYRKQALVHIVGALETLHAMSSEMEDMRERVAASDLLRSQIPAEVHMMSIQAGLSRLGEGRIKAKRQEEIAVGRMMSMSLEE